VWGTEALIVLILGVADAPTQIVAVVEVAKSALLKNLNGW
jgi:hypothetical protein